MTAWIRHLHSSVLQESTRASFPLCFWSNKAEMSCWEAGAGPVSSRGEPTAELMTIPGSSASRGGNVEAASSSLPSAWHDAQLLENDSIS